MKSIVVTLVMALGLGAVAFFGTAGMMLGHSGLHERQNAAMIAGAIGLAAGLILGFVLSNRLEKK